MAVTHIQRSDGETSLYAQLGGHDTLVRVHKVFYDKVYAHPWLKLFFVGVERAVIENQQTDFMAQSMKGPDVYCGKFPVPAHKHMFITAELYDTRHQLLADTLQELRIPEPLKEQWLLIDAAFKVRLVKKTEAECEGRYRTEPIMVIPNPEVRH